MDSTYNYDIEYELRNSLSDLIDNKADIQKVKAHIDNIDKEIKQNALEIMEKDEINNMSDITPSDIELTEESENQYSIDDITVKVSVGEKCSIELAKKLNIFSNENYILNLTEEELSKINVYNDNNFKEYSICNVSGNKAYENCALAKKNPYLTYQIDKSNKPVCSIASIEELPKNNRYEVKYKSDKNTIIKPESEIYFKNNKKNFCEERWQDWFCIANYHLNNRWLNEKPNELSETKSIGNCLRPCRFGYIPDDGNIRKCIQKNVYDGGNYNTSFDYTPLALICLFGTTFNTFTDETSGYPFHLKKIKDIINGDEAITLIQDNNSTNIVDILVEKIKNKNNNIWTSIKDDIKKSINEFFSNIPDINDNFIQNNITVPDDKIINLMQKYIVFSHIKYAYSIAYNIHYMMTEDIDKYKEWYYELKQMSELPKEKFKLLLKVLKHSCNICFDNKSTFSSNYILFSINTGIINEDEKYKPIEIDINYDPSDDDVEINDFKIVEKWKKNILDLYVDDFVSYDESIKTFLTSLIVVLIFFILYIMYIVFYEYINMILNVLFTFFVYRYYDIKYNIGLLFDNYLPDTREVDTLTFIRDSYTKISDYDIQNYLEK
jgi:hypothetical protein